MSKRITFKKVMRSIAQMFTLILVVLYIAGTSQLETIHKFAHDHDETISHSDEQEKDPCHRLIYHEVTGQGCNHDQHLIASDKCQMCDLVCHRDQNLLSKFIFSSAQFTQEYFNFYKDNLDSYLAVISSSRAPPIVV